MTKSGISSWFLIGMTTAAGGVAAGLVGAVIFGVGIALLGPWQKIQSIVGWSLVVVLFCLGIGLRMVAPQHAQRAGNIAAHNTSDEFDTPAATSVSIDSSKIAPSNISFSQQVQEDIWNCMRVGGKEVACYVDGTPKRCRQEALNLFANLGAESRRAWGICVQSCDGSASAECKHD